MANSELPNLPDFESIKDIIDTERSTILRVNDISEEEGIVRDQEDALVVLEFIQNVQESLHELFKEYPSLILLFNHEFGSYQQFLMRENIVETIFLDDSLFPDLEMFYFGQDGGISPQVLKVHQKFFTDWIRVKKEMHENAQAFLKEKFTLESKIEELECPCANCQSEFKTRLREHVYNECRLMIENSISEIEKVVDHDIAQSSDLYLTLKSDLDKKLKKSRSRLKRSTLNRLENQLKSYMSEKFTFPSELARRREKSLMPFFDMILKEKDISEDFVGEREFKRFFNQISTNLWKGKFYLEKEFEKLIKSVLVLKRKDISGTILQEYLGEFWVHSLSRTIKRKIVYHMGPTNSGKTYHAIEKLSSVEKGCYLAPLRLLAGELYDTLNNKGVKTTLLTGEEVIEVPDATHYSSTIEMARLQERFDVCVIDEIQMITDSQRGWAWTRALVNVFADEVHLCGDASVLNLIEKIVELCGDELIINNYERMTELNVEDRPIKVGNLQKHDALVVFSRRNALRFKQELERLDFKVSIVYGRLSPEVRREQARKFDEGETDIIVSTDAIAMGMNLPIRRIVFSTLSKFINSQEFIITESEIKQIAGRAGRFKRFPTGYVTCLQSVEDGLELIDNALHMELPQQKRCMVGPDLDIFSQVNNALKEHNLKELKLSEFLRLFNTMQFQKPFYCVELKEMIELAEMVEEADKLGVLSSAETFGFACAPVNMGLMEHLQHYNWILNGYVNAKPIKNDPIDSKSSDIDYLETSIKCVELYQWLSRHFNNKHFEYDELELLENKKMAIEKLNKLLSSKIVPTCASCGCKLPEKSKFAICEDCFQQRRFSRGRRGPSRGNSNDRGGLGKKKSKSSKRGGFSRSKKKGSYSRKRKNRK